jgi:purine-nucleoside phosphorylase
MSAMAAGEPNRDYAEFQAQAERLRPQLALILGSGLGGVAARISCKCEVDFAALPGVAMGATVAGHRGTLVLGTWSGQPLLVFIGRLHFYEGHSWSRVVRPVQLAWELGARMLITTNAAGGIRDDLAPGTLLALRDHIDCTLPGWWRSRRTEVSPYTPAARGLMQRAAQEVGRPLPEGTYAQVTGPCYETPAEVRALRSCGVDAVGMSTAREIQAGADLGMQCAAISCITNRAAGLSPVPLHHDEVIEMGARQEQRLADLLETFVRRAL